MAFSTDPTKGANQNTPRPTATDSATQKLLGNQMYDIKIVFNNYTNPRKYILPTNLIYEFVIEEDLLKWPYKGYITYKNIYEGLERALDINDDALYIYRMDARDELTIEMKPLTPADKGDLPEKIWNLNFDMVIYDTEDIPVANNTQKAKRIYFHDKRYQMLMDKKIQWSTATTNYNEYTGGGINPSLATDDERSMYTGDAIQALLKDAGFGDHIDYENWDTGLSRVFYTSPSNASIAEDLQYLLAHHVCGGGDFPIFKLDRGASTPEGLYGKWQLLPAQKFFDKAGKSADKPGPWQIEHLFFEDVMNESGIGTTPLKAPLAKTDSKKYDIDINLNEWNKITTYEFVDMSGLDNAKTLISKPVYWYDPNKKQFGVDYEENEIQKIKSDFQNLYTDKLYGGITSNKAAPLFTLNNTKKNQYNVQNEFCYATVGCCIDQNARLAEGKGRVLFSSMFLNECIYLRLLGSPHRLAGRFIAIDRLAGNDNELDKKLCGQWFVVNVKHIIQHTKYVNDVIAVKVHSYEDLNINEDVD